MNLSVKISLSSFLVLIFSILILFIFINENSSQSNDGKSISSDDFYSQEFDSQNEKIIFIGSSHVGRVNATYIQEQITLKKEFFDVYNLAMSSDTPSNRLKSIDKIISLNPSLVIYGIGFRDFSEFILKSELDKPESILPDTSQILPQIILIFEKSFNIDTNDFKSPKIITIQKIKNFLGLEDEISNTLLTPKNMPFYNIVPGFTTPLNDAELKRALASDPYTLSEIDPSSKNILSFKKIISQFNEHNIPVIIYTTPKSKLFLDSMSIENKNLFSSILNEISNEKNVTVHFLHEKYVNENIWNNNMHVIFGSENVIHNIDLANIIINFLEK